MTQEPYGKPLEGPIWKQSGSECNQCVLRVLRTEQSPCGWQQTDPMKLAAKKAMLAAGTQSLVCGSDCCECMPPVLPTQQGNIKSLSEAANSLCYRAGHYSLAIHSGAPCKIRGDGGMGETVAWKLFSIIHVTL